MKGICSSRWRSSSSACWPENPGMLRSDNTICGLNSVRASMKRASSSTSRTSYSMPSASSSDSTSSASSWLSSTCSTRMVGNVRCGRLVMVVPATIPWLLCACAPLANCSTQPRPSAVVRLVLFWRLVEHRPELSQGAHRVEKLVHVDRLDHIGVGTQVPTPRQVALLARGRQDHHRNPAHAFVFAHSGGPARTALAGHLDVQRVHGRTTRLPRCPGTTCIQVVNSLHTILNVHHRVGQMRF